MERNTDVRKRVAVLHGFARLGPDVAREQLSAALNDGAPEVRGEAARLLGPTGGYLMAYPIAAFVTGWLAERGFDRRYTTAVVAMLAGLAYGWVYLRTERITASAVTHAAVDWIWILAFQR